MALVLLDSLVVAGLLKRDDRFHRAAVERMPALARHNRLIASVITYAEVMAGAGAGHHKASVVRGFFDEVIAELLPVDKAVAERAARLRAGKRGLHLPDALILATAELAGADLVVGGDARWARIPGYGCSVELLKSS